MRDQRWSSGKNCIGSNMSLIYQQFLMLKICKMCFLIIKICKSHLAATLSKLTLKPAILAIIELVGHFL